MHQLDDLIIQAIKEKRLVRFDYDGRGRLVEPHAFGVRGENRMLEAYQTDGHSSRPLPGWRNFETDRIAAFIVLDDHFSRRPDFALGEDRWDSIFERA